MLKFCEIFNILALQLFLSFWTSALIVSIAIFVFVSTAVNSGQHLVKNALILENLEF